MNVRHGGKRLQNNLRNDPCPLVLYNLCEAKNMPRQVDNKMSNEAAMYGTGSTTVSVSHVVEVFRKSKMLLKDITRGRLLKHMLELEGHVSAWDLAFIPHSFWLPRLPFYPRIPSYHLLKASPSTWTESRWVMATCFSDAWCCYITEDPADSWFD